MTERTAIERLEAWNEGNAKAIPPGYYPDGSWFQNDIRTLIAAVKRRGDLLRAILEAEERGQDVTFTEALDAAADEIGWKSAQST